MKFNYYTKRSTGFGYNLWVANTDEYVTIAKFANNQYLVSNEARGCEEMFDNLMKQNQKQHTKQIETKKYNKKQGGRNAP